MWKVIYTDANTGASLTWEFNDRNSAHAELMRQLRRMHTKGHIERAESSMLIRTLDVRTHELRGIFRLVEDQPEKRSVSEMAMGF